ncbi:MAG: Transposase IS66 family protein [Pelotomaculum sp. PtaB.Bin013]|nr:MAG: Transposase IS66 family protein [Pelotomaculum sp. PtaB.Bin013]
MRQKEQEIVRLTEEIEKLRLENEALKAFLNKRNRTIFAPSSEKSSQRKKSPKQELSDVYAKQRGARHGHKGHGRNIPDLPEVVRIHEVPEDMRCCPHCGKPADDINLIDVSYEIDYEIKFYRVKHVRKKVMRTCSCPGPRIITAPKPNQAVPKGKYSNNFLAHALTTKYLYQIPLHRQVVMMQRQGLTCCEGTLTGLFKALLPLLEPLYLLLLEISRRANHWLVDETGWLNFVQAPGKKGHRWWLWVFVSEAVIVFVLDPSRSSNVPFQHFGLEAGGIFNCDRYSAYGKLETLVPGLIRALCWSHFRRDFIEAGESLTALKPWADEWLVLIARIYRLNDAQLAVREDPVAFGKAQAELAAALDEMVQRSDKELNDPSLHWQKRKVLESARRNWPGLTVFVEHPEVPMDNNEAERALRLAALGRKNYYGTHSFWSGRLAAVCLSIFQTATRHGLNPEAYLRYYLDNCVAGGPPPDLERFLPWNIPQEIVEKYSLRTGGGSP